MNEALSELIEEMWAEAQFAMSLTGAWGQGGPLAREVFEGPARSVVEAATIMGHQLGAAGRPLSLEEKAQQIRTALIEPSVEKLEIGPGDKSTLIEVLVGVARAALEIAYARGREGR